MGASVPVETLLVVGPPVVVEASRVEVPASVVLPGTEVRPSLAQALRAYLTMASASLPDGVPVDGVSRCLGSKGRLQVENQLAGIDGAIVAMEQGIVLGGQLQACAAIGAKGLGQVAAFAKAWGVDIDLSVGSKSTFLNSPSRH